VRFDLPTPDDETRPFWDAARAGRLVIKRCRACGRAHHYPRPFCPYCWSREVAWEDARGTGTVYTYSVVRRPQAPVFEAPYVVAEVELDEGPRLLANVVGIDPDAVSIGLRVRVGFEDFESISLYHFLPET
jgi:uncharacterized OB-fold protein